MKYEPYENKSKFAILRSTSIAINGNRERIKTKYDPVPRF